MVCIWEGCWPCPYVLTLLLACSTGEEHARQEENSKEEEGMEEEEEADTDSDIADAAEDKGAMRNLFTR